MGGGAAALGATVGFFPLVFFHHTVKPGGGCVALHTVSIRTAHGGTLGTRVRLCRQTMAEVGTSSSGDGESAAPDKPKGSVKFTEADLAAIKQTSDTLKVSCERGG